PGPGGARASRAPGGRDLPTPRLPREPRDRQNDRRAAPRADVPRDGAPPPRPPRRGRPSRARGPVRRADGDQDRARDPKGARRRVVHRRGLRALDLGGPARLWARGNRDAAEADGGLPPPPRTRWGRLPAS